MESLDPYCRLYDSTRQAIAAAQTSTVSRQQKQQDLLEDTLGRLVDEAHNNSGKRARPGSAPSIQAVVDDGPKEGEEDKREGECAVIEGQCLGLLAEAFADDLDLLRKDEHFGGSPKSIAAMADMMRCLAGGLDATEQRMLLENATR